jgi:hypothetical protein
MMVTTEMIYGSIGVCILIIALTPWLPMNLKGKIHKPNIHFKFKLKRKS